MKLVTRTIHILGGTEENICALVKACSIQRAHFRDDRIRQKKENGLKAGSLPTDKQENP